MRIFPFEDLDLCMAVIPFVFLLLLLSPFASAVFVASLNWFREWLRHRIWHVSNLRFLGLRA